MTVRVERGEKPRRARSVFVLENAAFEDHACDPLLRRTRIAATWKRLVLVGKLRDASFLRCVEWQVDVYRQWVVSAQRVAATGQTVICLAALG